VKQLCDQLASASDENKELKAQLAAAQDLSTDLYNQVAYFLSINVTL